MPKVMIQPGSETILAETGCSLGQFIIPSGAFQHLFDQRKIIGPVQRRPPLATDIRIRQKSQLFLTGKAEILPALDRQPQEKA